LKNQFPALLLFDFTETIIWLEGQRKILTEISEFYPMIICFGLEACCVNILISVMRGLFLVRFTLDASVYILR